MLTPEQRATLRKSANDPSQLFDAGMMSLVLDALDAAEQRAAELERRVSILTEYRDAMMEGIGIDPAEINTYSPMALKGIASVLYDAGERGLKLEARVAELISSVRAVYEVDHLINEMHAKRALRQLAYKNGGEE